MENFGEIRIVERFDGAPDDLSQVRAGPSACNSRSCARPSASSRPSIASCASCVLGSVAQALRGNGAHRRQRVLDAVVKLFQNQLLQFVGGFARLGLDAGLLQQGLGAELGLGQQ